jgi:Mg2+ and Co2+ transporter CorA
MPHLYDSGDPNLPDLPRDFSLTNESDEYSEDDSIKSINEDKADVHLQRQETRLFDEDRLNRAKRRKKRKRKNRKYSESAYSSTAARQRIAWEPGIDIHNTDVIISSLGSAITITDYNKDRYRVEHIEVFTNIQDDGSSSESKQPTKHCLKVDQSVKKLKKVLNSRPSWSKIRWINVNGLSWEAISTIGEKYNLHRLSIEDMIDVPQRTKTDFYPGHVFGVLPLIKLVRDVQEASVPNIQNSSWAKFLNFFNLYDYNDGMDEQEPEKLDSSLTELIPKRHDMRRLNDSFYPRQYTHRRGRLLDDQRPLSYRKLFVGVEQCSFFMKNDGTIISFFESSGDDIETAILSRISANETILRTSCDVSILLQSILDAVVDITYPVITAYRKRLSEFEIDILTNPDLRYTQTLHLMSGELAKLRRTLLPTSSMINSLRDLSKANKNSTKTNEHSKLVKSLNGTADLISPVTEVYLADIVDHTMMFTDEIEEMISKVENLVALMFNTISTDTNESMKILSLVTVIFLPLSFWTGYYGMNFEKFGDLENNVSYYWKIAIPFSVGLLILISWSFSRRSFMKYRRIWKKKFSDMKVNRDIKREKKKHHRREQLKVKRDIEMGSLS